MKKILVTGASGQLGQCFKKASAGYENFDFTFAGSQDLDLSQFGVLEVFLRKNKFDYCINCGAYTNVEQAEKEQEMAYLINAEAVKNLAKVCDENYCKLVHFSTDYVFNGEKNEPYSEEDETEPLNVYGASKLLGEQHIQDHMEDFYIFRTSWLYSDIGHNFFNTIRKKIREGEPLGITTSQVGTPTNAHDIARHVLDVLSKKTGKYGLYHFSNLGEATWYDFAEEIIRNMDQQADLKVNNDFKTLATRPNYSVLSKDKALKNFEIPIPSWKESLKQLF